MDMTLKQTFLHRWTTYFAGAELPLVFYYTDDPKKEALISPPGEAFRCIFQDLAKVRAGKTCCFAAESLGCDGGKIYTGLLDDPSKTQGPRLRQLMCAGIPGTIKTGREDKPGEGKYKQDENCVDALVDPANLLDVPFTHIVFKRWDTLDKDDQPLGTIFFASPDIISGLFALANFDEPGLHGVMTPYASGCGAIVMFPYKELQSQHPRAVLGMFDIMPRRFVPHAHVFRSMEQICAHGGSYGEKLRHH
jgi:hypothetical protein